MERRTQALAESIGTAAQDRRLTVAAAESVTAGNIATSLAAAGGASMWLVGGIVAYQTPFKQSLLGVTGPSVITAQCATEMLAGVLRVSGADIAVATTGAGGPDPQEGQEPGTVFIACGTEQDHSVFEHHFQDDPAEVVARATEAALEHLAKALEGGTP